MRKQLPKARPWRCAAVAAVFLAVVAVTLGGAEARPAHSKSTSAAVAVRNERARKAALSAEQKKFGIPAPITAPPSNDPYDIQTPYDLLQQGTTARASRSKVSLTLPPAVLLTYVRTCGRVQGFDADGKPYFSQFCCPPDADGNPAIEPNLNGCKDDLIVRTPRTSSDDSAFNPDDFLSVNWIRNDAPIWVASPRGASRPYGQFPDVTVHLLAFGSVPTTAIVHISQSVDSRGQVEPLEYNDLQLQAGVPDGTTVAGFGQALNRDDTLFYDRTLTGSLSIRISNVKIDGQKLDVGDNCRTRSPATLTYKGPRGIANLSQTPDQLEGRPGEFDPLNSTNPGAANGSLSIPAFTGCKDGSGSLDPLITSLASGPINAVRLTLKSGTYDCSRPDNPLHGCPDYPGYSDGPVISPLERLAGAGSAAAARAAATTALQRMLSHMPAATRSRIVRGLPTQVRASLARVRR